MSIQENLQTILSQIPENVQLVAVSKTKPIEDILEAYNAGQRIFGENKIQEMADKYDALPKDIEWHMIGHVQTNKVKYMAPFVSLIHGVDSFKLLNEINKQAQKNNRVVNCLLQIKIAEEDSKFGLSVEDAKALLESHELKTLNHIKITGLMGMATFTDDEEQLSSEFNKLQSAFNLFKNMNNSNIQMTVLSMGMSGDFKIAIDRGSNMIRVGSSIFGERIY